MAFRQFSVVETRPGFTAAGDGGVCGGWAGLIRFGQDMWGWSNFGHDGFSLGGWVAAVLFIVRGGRVIFCKTPAVGWTAFDE
jgi:hypothetical protein